MKTKIVGILVVTLLIATALPAVGSMKVENPERILFEPNTASANMAWSDNFDSYAAGSPLHGQGGWEGWLNDPTATGYVSDDQFQSSPNSLQLEWFTTIGADMVQEFSDVNSGKWRLTAWQYIPSDQTGSAYFILLNTYSPTQSWSTQLRFSATEGIAVDYDDTSKTLPLVTDEWVQIRVDIDFVADQQVIYYNNDILNTKSWTDGASGGGALNLACVDLWAGDTSSPSTTFYYDDLVLAEVLPLSCDANGPYEGLVDEDIEMDGTATGGLSPYQYLWDFGDGNTSGDPHPTHNYANAGVYTVSLTVTDAEQSNAFDETTATINGPPNEPEIDGPAKGESGIAYDYDFTATDPDNDDIAEYIVDWGDGTGEEIITGPFASGEKATASHTWDEEGDYTITAKAKDINGLVGPEGTLTVTMPRNKVLTNTLFQKILNIFPNGFPILRQLIQRLGLQ